MSINYRRIEWLLCDNIDFRVLGSLTIAGVYHHNQLRRLIICKQKYTIELLIPLSKDKEIKFIKKISYHSRQNH